MAGELLGDLLIRVGLDNAEFQRGMADVGKTIERTASLGSFTNLPIIRPQNTAAVVQVAEQAAKARTTAVSNVVAKAAAEEERAHERFALGALRGGLRQTMPAMHIPVPFFGAGLPFIAGSVAVSAFAVALKDALGSAIAMAQALTTLHQATGLATEGSAAFAAQARVFGVDIATLNGGLAAMAIAVQTEQPALAALGVSLVDAAGKARPAADVFNDARDAISRIADPTLQAAYAERLFGAEGDKLLPLLRAQRGEIDQNAAAIAREAEQIAAAARHGADLERAGARAQSVWKSFTDFLGEKISGAVAGAADAMEEANVRGAAEQAAAKPGFMTDVSNPLEVRAAGDAAVAALRAKRDAEITASLEKAKTQDQTTVADMTRRASLEDQLANVAETRAGRLEHEKDAAIDAAESRADRLRHIAEQESDHLDELAYKQKMLTQTAGEYHKATTDAALRAREEEKAFFAFTPADGSARAEELWQRSHQRELDNEARLEVTEARHVAQQAAADATAAAREDREIKRIADEVAVIDAAHPDIAGALLAAQVAAAATAQAVAAFHERQDQKLEMKLEVTSPDGSVSRLDSQAIAAVVLDSLGQQALAARQIFRSGAP